MSDVMKGQATSPGLGGAREKPDPWRGRKQGMKCATCIWFVPKRGAIGRCRRHAPTMSGFPVVYETDWCGDHKLDESTVADHE